MWYQNPNPSLSGLQFLGSGVAQAEKIAQMLDGMSTFGDFAWPDLLTFAAYLQLYRAPAGAIIFREGDKGGSLAFVVEGRVDVFKAGRDGTPKGLSTVGPGRSFGEMSILDGERRSATAMASVATFLVALTRQDYDRLVEEQPKIAAKFILKVARLVSQRLRQVSGVLVEHLDGNTPPQT